MGKEKGEKIKEATGSFASFLSADSIVAADQSDGSPRASETNNCVQASQNAGFCVQTRARRRVVISQRQLFIPSARAAISGAIANIFSLILKKTPLWQK